jgi:hypothetical protein
MLLQIFQILSHKTTSRERFCRKTHDPLKTVITDVVHTAAKSVNLLVGVIIVLNIPKTALPNIITIRYTPLVDVKYQCLHTGAIRSGMQNIYIHRN